MRGARRLAGTLAGVFFGAYVSAQVAIPQVPAPRLPVELPVDIDGTIARAGERLDPRDLKNLRALRVRQLLRQNRALLEADPRGNPIVRSEIVAVSPQRAALERAVAAGFEVLRERSLEGLEARIVILRVPEKMSTRRALRKLKSLDPAGAYDFNHIYTESGYTADGSTPAPTGLQASAPAAEAHSRDARDRNARLKIGLIDAGIDTSHPAFEGARIRTRGCNGQTVASAHGTAVASLIVGHASQFTGAVPGATLLAVDVYCGLPAGGSVESIAEAFAWLARENVPVLNVSLVGPANRLLEQVVRAVIARGHVVVAAVGNDGPAAPPLYPASYPGVVGVTGVDAKRKALLEACRGPQVDFAAPGADMAAAGIDRAYGGVRGTSFAAPIVAGLIALHAIENAEGPSGAFARLASNAVDLGKRGPDTTFGNGLIGESLRMSPPSAASQPAPPAGAARNK